MIRKFRKLGFSGPASGGQHQFMVRGALKVHIPNPHGAGEIDDSLVKEILRQGGISVRALDEA